jgi:hypothetical protein
MAALRVDEKVTFPPVVYFLIAAFVSVVGGLATGFEIWILAGYSPDNSGGALIFVFGSCIMSLLSFVLGLFWKNRASLRVEANFNFRLTAFSWKPVEATAISRHNESESCAPPPHLLRSARQLFHFPAEGLM